MGHAKYYTYSSLISGLSGIVFFTLLIKPFGIMGIAVGKFASIVLTVIYYFYISKIRLQVSFSKCFKIIIYPFITAIIFIFAGQMLKSLVNNFFTLFIFSISISTSFLLVSWFTNQLDNSDKKIILDFLKVKNRY